MNRTVKDHTIAVLKAILQETLNQNRASRKYLIPRGKIEQDVFRALGCRKEKQKRNSRGYIRAALQALITHDAIIGVQNFDPDSDQLRRSDRPNHFRPTTRVEIWFRDNFANVKDAMKTESIVRALQAFGLITAETVKDSGAIQKTLFAVEQKAQPTTEAFTDETALAEIRNRVTTNDAAPWEREKLTDPELQPETTAQQPADAGPKIEPKRPNSLNEVSSAWWDELATGDTLVSKEYRGLRNYFTRARIIQHVREIAADYISTVKKVSISAAGDLPLQWNQNKNKLDTSKFGDKTPIEMIIEEIILRAILYAEALVTAGLKHKDVTHSQADSAISLMIEMLEERADCHHRGVFSTDLPKFSQRYKNPGHGMSRTIDVVKKIIGRKPLSSLNNAPPAVLRDKYCEQMIVWRKTITRQSSRRKIIYPARIGFYLTPFGKLVAAMLQALYREFQDLNQAGGENTHETAAQIQPAEKEGSLLKGSKKYPAEKSGESIKIPIRTKEGSVFIVDLKSVGGTLNADITDAELRASLGAAAVPATRNDDENSGDLLAQIKKLPSAPYRVVDLARSTKQEVRDSLALRRHEDVIAFLVPDVVKVLCERIVALQSVPIPADAPNGQLIKPDEVCKVALYYALTTLNRIINGLQHYIRKAAIEESAATSDDMPKEQPFTVDFLEDYAAQVALAIEALANGGDRILPLVTTADELNNAIVAAGRQEAPSWSLQRERKIESVNWLIDEATKPAT